VAVKLIRDLRAAGRLVFAAACSALAAGCAIGLSTPARPSTAAPSRAAARSSTPPPSLSARATCRARGRGLFSLPDPRCTPGAISPAVTQANIESTICRAGYTKTVRPPESVTEPEKLASLAAYGDAGSAHEYEYDHLVPLELGGAPNDPRNLWPEPGATANPKDQLEHRLHAMVCDRDTTLARAQAEIAHDWVATYHRLFT
jgi:hypothetical protein